MREVVQAFDGFLSGASDGPGISSHWFTTYVRQRVQNAPVLPQDTNTASEEDLRPALEVAQEIAAWDTQLYRVRGDLTRHFPKLDALIARLDRILKDQPAIAWARFYRGVAWFRRGELKRALDDMEKSIDRVRDLAGAYFELGRLYLAIYLDEHRAAHLHLSRVGTENQLKSVRTPSRSGGHRVSGSQPLEAGTAGVAVVVRGRRALLRRRRSRPMHLGVRRDSGRRSRTSKKCGA